MVRLKGGRTFFLSMVLFFALFLGLPRHLSCQDTGFKYIKNFTPKDYDHRAQNWSILQDNRGIIYVANNGGVLEHDGVSWRVITIPGWNVYSLAMDNAGTVYIAGKDEIGFLAPDAKGTLQYKTLRDKLEGDQKNFSRARKTHSLKEGVYFRSSKFLFRWDGKKINTLDPKPAKKFNASFSCGGKLYIRQDEFGLMTIEGNQLKVIPGGKIFAAMKIFMIVPFDSQKMLIGTRENGFYLYDGTEAQPFSTEADDYVKENELYHGIRLRSGDFAMATGRGGLVIMDSHGRLKTIFNEDNGLLDNNVKYVFQDALGNLWLALENGITKIEYPSPISTYDKRSGLRGLVLSVTGHGHHNDLFAGTSRGLYYLSDSAGPGSPGKFRPVPGISSYCYSLLSVGDSLLAAASSGVFQVKHINENMTIRKVTGDRSFVLSPSSTYKNRIWVGARSGLFSLFLNRTNGQWQKEAEFENIKQEITTIIEDNNGNLWLGTLTKGVLKAGLQTGGNIIKPGVKHYSSDAFPGLTSGEIHVFWAAQHVMFATRQGIYQFDNETGAFHPDYTLGNEFAGGPHGEAVFRITADKENKDIWLHVQLRNIQTIHLPGGTFEIIEKPFLRIPPAQVNVIYPGPDGNTVWFGGTDGLTRFDKTVKKNYRHDFSTCIRQVVANGELLFDGYETKSKFFYPALHHNAGNLHFEFAAPFFEAEELTTYRYRLQGYENQWSQWTSETKKEYYNLDPGTYTFQVQARNTYENLGREATFKFRILLPWYRTWWAFLSYGFALFLLTYLVVKWRHSLRLKREKQRLEQTVKERTKELRERTAEIEEKNQQLEKQTLRLKEQSEKLKEMDQVKSRFFANISHEFRTPLTLIMGPLEQMLASCPDKEQERKINMMLRNSQRLLGLINQLLELSKFESGKVKLQTRQQKIIPFLKGIVAAFGPAAAKNELDLSFHIKEGQENITLYFDPEKLEDVFFNILANAIKFTPPGGRITVAAVRDKADKPAFPQGSLAISVCDTGPGIPRDQLSHIFDRFYQSDSTYEHHRKGSGIGLAIAKEIVELHHGKINVHSLEGKGTEFIIRLPLQGAHADYKGVLADVKFDYKVLPEEVEFCENEGDEAVTVGDENDIDHFKQANDIILIVEDSTDVREYIRESLEPDYTVIEAKDGREGIQKAQEIIPDLIISDIMMPEADGYELCRVIKNDKNTSHVPVILLTARASEESILQGLETGADDYVTKPFNTKILYARIKNLIDLRRQMQLNLNREMTLQPVKTSVSNLDKEFIRELQKVIEKNLSEPEFNVEELKNKLYISRTSLYRKIQALSGQSPTDFIRSYRLKRAAQLLKSGFGSVTEVAFEVGFTSRSYFAKCFKEKFHLTPSTFMESESRP